MHDLLTDSPSTKNKNQAKHITNTTTVAKGRYVAKPKINRVGKLPLPVVEGVTFADQECKL